MSTEEDRETDGCPRKDDMDKNMFNISKSTASESCGWFILLNYLNEKSSHLCWCFILNFAFVKIIS